ncbi:protein SCO1/2 [Spirosomataceae bacterium TFI 002]|nr:protein SCO1/2 [Spirosomataceae bacterium TFI 002]
MSNKIVKTGILIVLLVIPVFVFIFLNTFGSNKFDLPYYFPELNEKGNAQVSEKGDTLFQKVPAFELIDQNGELFNSSDLVGKTFVVNFFFSRCGAICPTMNSNLARAYDNVDINKTRFVSISIDPEYDTDSVLNVYSKEYSANSVYWKFLTGDKAYIYNLAINGFKLPVADASSYDSNLSIDETFIHSEKFLLVDSHGYFRGIYDGTSIPEVERLMVEIDILNLEKK